MDAKVRMTAATDAEIAAEVARLEADGRHVLVDVAGVSPITAARWAVRLAALRRRITVADDGQIMGPYGPDGHRRYAEPAPWRSGSPEHLPLFEGARNTPTLVLDFVSRYLVRASVGRVEWPIAPVVADSIARAILRMAEGTATRTLDYDGPAAVLAMVAMQIDTAPGRTILRSGGEELRLPA
jgi:hypothetical protein